MSAVATLVPLEEYLSPMYHPDRDYVDGVLEERNLGEILHGDCQGSVGAFFRIHRRSWGVWAAPEVRLQVRPGRFRIPDLVVTLGDRPQGRYLVNAPFLCIEILSPEDRMSRIETRIDEYLEMGVPYVWLLDPESKRGWVYTRDGRTESQDGVMRTANPELAMPLSEAFLD